ncbi:hypothetical protein [Actinokineospora terrae]|uniref:Uncharacterized protein n=1 Tax=Actinokineospora terrae TaxID=155974 RepID=A0A1H9XTS2_9PSEU|nr:hypothetical protein [Actinokineospora terrae]SES49117.1 hypothetical protein SAMN04487818_12432 [Actinokineospora terrae]
MTDTTLICKVCDRALLRRTDENGVTFLHPVALGKVEHEPVPVQAPPGWRGLCDFCTDGHSEFLIPANIFTVPTIPGAPIGMSDIAWSACSICTLLVESDRWNTLLNRTAATHERRYGEPMPELARTFVRKLHRKLRANITGSAQPIDPGQETP